MIDLESQYETQGNKPVRIYAVNCGDRYSVHGAIKYDNGWWITSWTADGKSPLGFMYDLKLVSHDEIKITGYVVHYKDGAFGSVHRSLDQAKKVIEDLNEVDAIIPILGKGYKGQNLGRVG